MIKLHFSDGEPVWVNGNNICYVRVPNLKNSPPDINSFIIFFPDATGSGVGNIFVKERPEEIARLMHSRPDTN